MLRVRSRSETSRYRFGPKIAKCKGRFTHVPTILRSGPYRFFFFSNERAEPAHVHVQRDRKLAKFWLSPVSVPSVTRLRGSELSTLESIVRRYRRTFLEAWNGYFSDTT